MSQTQPAAADQIGDPSALTAGYSAAFVGAGVIALVGALAAAAFLRRPTEAAQPGAAKADQYV